MILALSPLIDGGSISSKLGILHAGLYLLVGVLHICLSLVDKDIQRTLRRKLPAERRLVAKSPFLPFVEGK